MSHLVLPTPVYFNQDKPLWASVNSINPTLAVSNLTVTNNLTVGSNLTVANNLTVGSNLTVGGVTLPQPIIYAPLFISSGTTISVGSNIPSGIRATYGFSFTGVTGDGGTVTFTGVTGASGFVAGQVVSVVSNPIGSSWTGDYTISAVLGGGTSIQAKSGNNYPTTAGHGDLVFVPGNYLINVYGALTASSGMPETFNADLVSYGVGLTTNKTLGIGASDINWTLEYVSTTTKVNNSMYYNLSGFSQPLNNSYLQGAVFANCNTPVTYTTSGSASITRLS